MYWKTSVCSSLNNYLESRKHVTIIKCMSWIKQWIFHESCHRKLNFHLNAFELIYSLTSRTSNTFLSIEAICSFVSETANTNFHQGPNKYDQMSSKGDINRRGSIIKLTSLFYSIPKIWESYILQQWHWFIQRAGCQEQGISTLL